MRRSIELLVCAWGCMVRSPFDELLCICGRCSGKYWFVKVSWS